MTRGGDNVVTKTYQQHSTCSTASSRLSYFYLFIAPSTHKTTNIFGLCVLPNILVQRVLWFIHNATYRHFPQFFFPFFRVFNFILCSTIIMYAVCCIYCRREILYFYGRERREHSMVYAFYICRTTRNDAVCVLATTTRARCSSWLHGTTYLLAKCFYVLVRSKIFTNHAFLTLCTHRIVDAQ